MGRMGHQLAAALVALAALQTSGCATRAIWDSMAGREDREFAWQSFAFQIEAATLVEPGLLWLRGLDLSEGKPVPWHASISLADAVTRLREPASRPIFVPHDNGADVSAVAQGTGTILVTVPWLAWRRVREPARGVAVDGAKASCSFLGLFQNAGSRVQIEEIPSGSASDVPPPGSHPDPAPRLFVLRSPVQLASATSPEDAPIELIVDARVLGEMQRFELAFLANPRPPHPNPRAAVALPVAVALDVAAAPVLGAYLAPYTLVDLYATRRSRAVEFGRLAGCACVERPFWFQRFDRDRKNADCYGAGRDFGPLPRR